MCERHDTNQWLKINGWKSISFHFFRLWWSCVHVCVCVCVRERVTLDYGGFCFLRRRRKNETKLKYVEIYYYMCVLIKISNRIITIGDRLRANEEKENNRFFFYVFYVEWSYIISSHQKVVPLTIIFLLSFQSEAKAATRTSTKKKKCETNNNNNSNNNVMFKLRWLNAHRPMSTACVHIPKRYHCPTIAILINVSISRFYFII